tara:strand:- start:169 stop:1716 length:1548 start_codon:yes stop_codon:yes gene_type:complete
MLNLWQALDRTIRHNLDRKAIIEHINGDALVTTWREFGERVSKASGVLLSQGVAKKVSFGICMKNSARFDELKWAGFRAGAIPVPINWRLAPPEIVHILKDSDVETIFLEADFLPLFEAPELAPWRGNLVCTNPVDDSQKVVLYDDLFAAATIPEAAEVDPDDDAILLYTGGTTGRSKGVRLSHTNIITCAVAYTLGLQGKPDDVYLHVPPMFHSADLLATGWFLMGAGQAYLPMFSPSALFETIENCGVTVIVLVPTMVILTLNDPGLAAFDRSSLRRIAIGSAPLAPELAKGLAENFPAVGLSNTYGLTEVAPDLTIFEPDEFREAIEHDLPHKASVGKPNILVDLKLVGPDGEEVAPGDSGELWARGPNIMKGYLNLPEQTAEVLVDGWFWTGDIARFDENGYVYLLDRSKDMIISGGENVYSSEVENILYKHPDIMECAVIGIPDDKLGEKLMAVIVSLPDTNPTSEGIIAHCREMIGGYKIPRQIEFVEAMPKNAMGKILKNELRNIYGR